MADGFLARWSRRKQDVREGRQSEQPVPEAQTASIAPTTPAASGDLAQSGQAPKPGSAQSDGDRQAAPTLEDAQQLGPESDFKPYLAQGVDPQVRNVALKKLFADPHFNVMDGLDIYIDDYSIPSPLPASLARRMVGAQLLNLFDDESQPAAENQAGPSGSAAATPSEPGPAPLAAGTAQSEAETAPARRANSTTQQDEHAHPDLRLQPNHAALGRDPGRGAQ